MNKEEITEFNRMRWDKQQNSHIFLLTPLCKTATLMEFELTTKNLRFINSGIQRECMMLKMKLRANEVLPMRALTMNLSPG